MKYVRGLVLAASFILLFSCSDRPKRAKFPGPQGQTTSSMAARNAQAVLGGFDPEKERSQVREVKSIRGVAKLAKGVQLPKKSFVVFISARSKEGGPPVAAKKLPANKFPLRFSLSAADAMMGGTRFVGELSVQVKVDQIDEDGISNPISTLPGDLVGKVSAKVGDQDLIVELK